VIARTTAFTYKGKAVDIKDIGRNLRVRYVIEGSVRRGGDKVQVNVQLIDAETGAHIWADRFDTDRTKLPEARSEITGRLARALHLRLIEAEGRRIEHSQDPDAQDLIMRGWASYYRPIALDNRQEAQRAFERVLEIDPVSIEAKIGLATVLTSNITDGLSKSVEQDKALSEKLLLQVIQRDANRSMAYLALGRLRRIDNRLTEAQVEYERAIALDPNNAIAIHNLAITLMFLGQPASGIPLEEKVMRLNPLDQHVPFYWALGSCHLLINRVDEAINLLKKQNAINQGLSYNHYFLAGALGFKGDLEGGRAALNDFLKLKPEINSLARYRARWPFGNPQYWDLHEQTVNVGLRRMGFPEE